MPQLKDADPDAAVAGVLEAGPEPMEEKQSVVVVSQCHYDIKAGNMLNLNVSQPGLNAIFGALECFSNEVAVSVENELDADYVINNTLDRVTWVRRSQDFHFCQHCA
jgi:hypothetical protein